MQPGFPWFQPEQRLALGGDEAEAAWMLQGVTIHCGRVIRVKCLLHRHCRKPVDSRAVVRSRVWPHASIHQIIVYISHIMVGSLSEEKNLYCSHGWGGGICSKRGSKGQQVLLGVNNGVVAGGVTLHRLKESERQNKEQHGWMSRSRILFLRRSCVVFFTCRHQMASGMPASGCWPSWRWRPAWFPSPALSTCPTWPAARFPQTSTSPASIEFGSFRKRSNAIRPRP